MYGVVHLCAQRNPGYAGRNHLVTTSAYCLRLALLGRNLVTLFRNQLVTTP